MTFLDTAVSVFFASAGADFIITIFAVPIIAIIVIATVRPFDV